MMSKLHTLKWLLCCNPHQPGPLAGHRLFNLTRCQIATSQRESWPHLRFTPSPPPAGAWFYGSFTKAVRPG